MKSKIKGKYILLFTILLCVFSVFMIINIYNNKKEMKMLGGMKIPNSATFLEEEDTHGGMGNDGEYFAKIKISENDKEKFLKEALKEHYWNKTPIDEKLLSFIMHTDYEDNFKKYIGMFDSNFKVDDNIEGIYFFKDRFSQSPPKIFGPENKEYRTGNFTLSILDTKNNIIYIYLYDS